MPSDILAKCQQPTLGQQHEGAASGNCPPASGNCASTSGATRQLATPSIATKVTSTQRRVKVPRPTLPVPAPVPLPTNVSRRTRAVATTKRQPLTPGDAAKGIGVLALLALIIAVVVKAVAGGGSPEQQASSFMQADGADMVGVAATVNPIISELKVLKADADSNNASAVEGDLVNLATYAKAAQGALGTAATQFAGATGDDELPVFDATDELKTAMADVVAFTDNQDATNRASLQSDLGTGEADWNDAVTRIYGRLGRTGPDVPTVTVWP